MGADDHPSFQQIAFRDQETGACSDREGEKFNGELKQRGVSVRVGMEVCWLHTLVRALTGRARFQGADWRCGRDQREAPPVALVQMRTRIMNQDKAVAVDGGQHWKRKLFSDEPEAGRLGRRR
jgi:hypothetical protein